MLRLRRSRGGLGHVPILCIWARACLAWAVAGKDGIMAGGTSSTAITGASGRLICVTCRSNPGSSLSSGSHSGSFPAHHKSGTKLVARPKRKDNNSQNILSGWLRTILPLNIIAPCVISFKSSVKELECCLLEFLRASLLSSIWTPSTL